MLHSLVQSSSSGVKDTPLIIDKGFGSRSLTEPPTMADENKVGAGKCWQTSKMVFCLICK